MIRRCLLRSPRPGDLEDLIGVYRAEKDLFAKDPQAAKKAASFGDLPPDPSIEAGELAAWTMVANVILNLDEFLTKR
jgi:hypothetical protein